MLTLSIEAAWWQVVKTWHKKSLSDTRIPTLYFLPFEALFYLVKRDIYTTTHTRPCVHTHPYIPHERKVEVDI